MKISLKSFVIISVILSSSVAFAGNEYDYLCTIERVHNAVSDAALSARERAYVGEKFYVDRSSGLMTGILKNSYVTAPVVIDHGSKDSSFKAVTTMRRDEGAGYGSNLYSLVVGEYANTVTKPFVFLSNEDVYFGNCVHS